MKKILLLLFTITIVFGCKKKKEIRKDLIGYWVYEDAGTCVNDSCVRDNYSGFTCDGFYFMENKKCKAIWLGSNLTNLDVNFKLAEVNYYLDNRYEGKWSNSVNEIKLDWGDYYFPSGKFSLNTDEIDDNIIYINDVKFTKVENVNELQ